MCFAGTVPDSSMWKYGRSQPLVRQFCTATTNLSPIGTLIRPGTNEPGMDDRTITTRATGRARRDPERAQVHLEAKGHGGTPGQARERAQETLERVRSELADVGEWSSRLVEFRANDRTFPTEEDPPYVAVARLAVDCSPEDAAEAVVVGTDVGAEVADVAFDLTDETRADLSGEELEQGVAAARRKAETLALAEGVELDGLVRIDADDHERSSSIVDAALESSRGFEFQPAPVEVAVDVTASYSIA